MTSDNEPRPDYARCRVCRKIVWFRAMTEHLRKHALRMGLTNDQ